ncbi:MAG: hypothetical protein GF330_10120 [Candidatus Eisenbacteria bacterium]|nr:hypothetical protein [Candidatus Eisenbacteria bacterium]
MQFVRASVLLTVALLIAGPALAVDENFDMLDDAIALPDGVYLPDATIAVVNADDSAANYQDRLITAGYTSTLIPVSSDYSVLSQYDMVLLPVSHAVPAHYYTLDALAGDYHSYVSEGGKLWIGQPNPYQMPDNTAEITWAPYDLTVNTSYTLDDCPSIIVDPDHCIAQGVSGSDLPMAGDAVREMGPEWHVVAEGPSTGLPAVFIACYGSGACLVELGHPSPNALCPYTDAGFYNMIFCLVEEDPSPADPTTWGSIKSAFE